MDDSAYMLDHGFDELFRREYPRMLHASYLIVGNREDARDVVQEAFARMILRWDRVSRYDKPGAWVRTVTIRLSVRVKERSRRFELLEDDVLVSTAPLSTGSTGSTGSMTASDDRIVVAQALGDLSPMQRAVVVLHYLDGLDVAEVAHTLRVRQGTVKTHLFRARQHLARALGEDLRS